MITFPFVGGERGIEPEKIIYVQTDRRLNVFHVSEGEKEVQYRLYKKLDEIEGTLLPYAFVRCHRSYLINLRYVAKVSNYLLTLKTGETFTIPRARYKWVKEQYVSWKNVDDTHSVLSGEWSGSE